MIIQFPYKDKIGMRPFVHGFLTDYVDITDAVFIYRTKDDEYRMNWFGETSTFQSLGMVNYAAQIIRNYIEKAQEEEE